MKVTILDPTAPPPVTEPDPGPDVGPLAGRRVGLRYDRAWRSWLWTLEEWEPRLRAAGVEVRRWEAGHRVGDAGIRTAEELAAFADGLDLAIVGLGN